MGPARLNCYSVNSTYQAVVIFFSNVSIHAREEANIHSVRVEWTRTAYICRVGGVVDSMTLPNPDSSLYPASGGVVWGN